MAIPLLSCGFRQILGPGHFLVDGVGPQQLAVGADAIDAALIQHHDPVGVFHRAQPLGDDERGGAGQSRAQGVPDLPVRLRIHGGRAVVQDQDLRPFQQSPGNAQALFLAAGEVAAALVHPGIVAFGHPFDEFVRTGPAAGFGDFFPGGFRIAPAQVVGYGAGKQHIFLQHHGHAFPQGFQPVAAHIHAAHLHAAARYVVQPGDQLHQGGFAAAGAPHEADCLPALYVQIDILQHRFPRAAFIGKFHVVEGHGPVGHGLHRVCRRREGALFPQHFHDPLDAFFRKGQHDHDHGQHHEGAQDLEAVGQQGGKLPDVQGLSLGGQDQFGPLGQQKHHDPVDADLHQGVVQGHVPFAFGEELLHLFGGFVEFGDFLFFPHKGLDHPDALDVLFHFIVQGVVLRKAHPELGHGYYGDLVQPHRQDGDHNQKAQGHAAAHVPGHKKRRQQVEGRPEGRADQHHESHLDVLDVGGEPGHQGGGGEPVDVAEGEFLDLVEYVLAQVAGKTAGRLSTG